MVVESPVHGRWALVLWAYIMVVVMMGEWVRQNCYQEQKRRWGGMVLALRHHYLPPSGPSDRRTSQPPRYNIALLPRVPMHMRYIL